MRSPFTIISHDYPLYPLPFFVSLTPGAKIYLVGKIPFQYV